MILFFTVMSVLYFVFSILLIVGWGKYPDVRKDLPDRNLPRISVVIAVRNEENTIAALLGDLNDQSYPNHLFEVVIINDDSTDRTLEILDTYKTKTNFKMIVHTLKEAERYHLSPKKSALKKGISLASGDYIMTTDGDCRVGKEWIDCFAQQFSKYRFLAGPVTFSTDNTLAEELQTLEMASLIGSGASLINLGYPVMCNGANLGFEKKSYNEVAGYDGNEEEVSGDDVFLMQKIHLRFPGSVTFLKAKDAMVTTTPPGSWQRFFWQRKRWSAKWNKYKLTYTKVLPVFLFFYYLSILVFGTYSVMDKQVLLWFGLFLMVKFVPDYVFLSRIMAFSGKKMNWICFLLAEVLYPFYVVFFGVSVHFGSFEWKERTYQA